jgi:tRNA U34 5-carboxymethylaminomethyl modifying GTPase MnmE/TrmE
MGNSLLSLIRWIGSENSAGILTVITGIIAWIVYKAQINAREREAAIILLNDIRNAERAIDNIKKGDDVFNEIISILPICSWDINYQIFTRHLSRDQFDLLNSFFNSCKAAQHELDNLRSYLRLAMEEKAKISQKVIIDLAIKLERKEEYESERKNILDQIHKEGYWFQPVMPKENLMKYINNIQKITGTVVLEELRKIARQ